jgi:hypothetical protein
MFLIARRRMRTSYIDSFRAKLSFCLRPRNGLLAAFSQPVYRFR